MASFSIGLLSSSICPMDVLDYKTYCMITPWSNIFLFKVPKTMLLKLKMDFLFMRKKKTRKKNRKISWKGNKHLNLELSEELIVSIIQISILIHLTDVELRPLILLLLRLVQAKCLLRVFSIPVITVNTQSCISPCYLYSGTEIAIIFIFFSEE